MPEFLKPPQGTAAERVPRRAPAAPTLVLNDDFCWIMFPTRHVSYQTLLSYPGVGRQPPANPRVAPHSARAGGRTVKSRLLKRPDLHVLHGHARGRTVRILRRI